MATPMAGNHLRDILDFQSQIPHPLAKIHVFEPHRMKVCVKTAQPLPHVAPEHQKRSRRLISFGGPVEIHVQTPIAAIHGIPRQQAIDAQDFEG
jgi:hypothetical protein